ncbi:MAG: phenylalanyl-tRNA synthetase alpha chain [archaeon GW2011_AR13]|nr:MAG: phenylalanyl-tRNA synthetase alpha chain [archaeon GW2011_AR13]
MENHTKLIESLSPNEIKVLPYLEESKFVNICIKSNLDKVAVLRALEYLQNKKILELTSEKKKIIEIGTNGALYKKKGLPERRLLNVLNDQRILLLKDAQQLSKLSDDEFKASIGVLKRKGLIDLNNGKIVFNAGKDEISKKSLEELFIDSLPLDYDSLTPEKINVLKSLQSRKDIVEVTEDKTVKIKVTSLGKTLMKEGLKVGDLIEQITPEILKKELLWKGKKFRRYDVSSSVPIINGGKRHFVNQAVDYARNIWTDMGFQEMRGDMIQSGFWNFDALFTAQDHKWDENDAKKMSLRTHTTCLSSKTLSQLDKNKLPMKFFSIGKCFRNETLDWSHGFEFNQSEGIVVDRNANFRHLLGYLKQFFKKMGYEKLRFNPAYFPYTEPSVEIHVWHPEKKVWLELGGAGIFRPEVVIPLFGEYIPVLAWGPGFDRVLMDYYKVKDLRELYKNNFTELRNKRFWMK